MPAALDLSLNKLAMCICSLYVYSPIKHGSLDCNSRKSTFGLGTSPQLCIGKGLSHTKRPRQGRILRHFLQYECHISYVRRSNHTFNRNFRSNSCFLSSATEIGYSLSELHSHLILIQHVDQRSEHWLFVDDPSSSSSKHITSTWNCLHQMANCSDSNMSTSEIDFFILQRVLWKPQSIFSIMEGSRIQQYFIETVPFCYSWLTWPGTNSAEFGLQISSNHQS